MKLLKNKAKINREAPQKKEKYIGKAGDYAFIFSDDINDHIKGTGARSREEREQRYYALAATPSERTRLKRMRKRK